VKKYHMSVPNDPDISAVDLMGADGLFDYVGHGVVGRWGL